jgi:hypothetical protein
VYLGTTGKPFDRRPGWKKWRNNGNNMEVNMKSIHWMFALWWRGTQSYVLAKPAEAQDHKEYLNWVVEVGVVPIEHRVRTIPPQHQVTPLRRILFGFLRLVLVARFLQGTGGGLQVRTWNLEWVWINWIWLDSEGGEESIDGFRGWESKGLKCESSSHQVAFGLMQTAMLLTGLERSIQNTRGSGTTLWC